MDSKPKPLSAIDKSKEPPPGASKKKQHWAMNRFSIVSAVFTFALIILGALVTNNAAGNSIPDWPLAFSRLIPTGHFSAGLGYELAHRILAAVVTLLVLCLFVWILVGERRGWIKWVGAVAFVLVLAQAGLGGLRVSSNSSDSPPIAMLHAFLAQIFLGVIVSLTVFTSPGWVRAGELRSGFPKAPKPLVFFITTAATAALVIQVMLGAAYRHRLIGVPSHVAGAIVAGGLILWGSILVVRLEHDRDREFPYLTRPARAGVWVLLFQLIAGVLAYFFRGGYAPHSVETDRAVATSVVHTGFSAALLVIEVMLLIRLYRMVPITESQV